MTCFQITSVLNCVVSVMLNSLQSNVITRSLEPDILSTCPDIPRLLQEMEIRSEGEYILCFHSRHFVTLVESSFTVEE